MPTYRCEVTEVRHAHMYYWVYAESLQDARVLAEIGDTDREEERGIEVAERAVHFVQEQES